MSVDFFDINIPNVTAAEPLSPGGVERRPLMIIKILVVLENDAAVQFIVTKEKPVGTIVAGPTQFPSAEESFGPSAAVSADSQTFPFGGDLVTFNLPLVPALVPANDPVRKYYIITATLLSNYDTANGCRSTISAPNRIRIAVSGSSPRISGAYLVSFSTRGAATCPVGNNVTVVLPNPSPPLGVAEIQGVTGGIGADLRPGIDVALVLDRSGSMDGAGNAGNPVPTRMQELHAAFLQFNQVWSNLRAREATPTLPPPEDRLAVTIFDDIVDWWNPPLGNGLNPFTAASPLITNTSVTSGSTRIFARGWTSIGGGLQQAAGILGTADSTRRRVILLMTDGLQNTDPLVGVDPTSTRVYLHTSSDASYSPSKDLVNQDNFQIFTVTVGPASTVDASVAINLAQATAGFYLNSETDASKQGLFFLQLLQNFVRFATWETHRIISSNLKSPTDTFTTTNAFSTTTTAVIFALRGPINRTLRISIVPPGGVSATEMRSAQTVNGIASVAYDLPVPDFTYGGDWTITVEEVPVILSVAVVAGPAAAAARPVPFDLVIIADDAALNARMRILPKNYAPGDAVEFEARVSEFGRPVSGLGGASGGQMLVQVVAPGAGVGDVLSASTAATAQPFAQDQLSAVQAKLYNQLQDDPNILQRAPANAVTLVEGSDGVYRGSFQVRTSGHYDFVFGLSGAAPNVARFTRQHFETVYVRPLPDTGTTEVQTSQQAIPGGTRVQTTFTPRTRFAERLGPGWANYFWFTAPGVTPFKPADNMDGSFSATLDVSGPVPPISLHFLDVAVKIGDAVPFDKLPLPLGQGTVLVPSVQPIDAPYVTTWLVLGPIFDPGHQPGPDLGGAGRPTAGDLLRDIDGHRDQLDPEAITGDPLRAPTHGDVVRAYGGSLVAARAHAWRKRRFEGMDWSSRSDIGDGVHSHLGGDYLDDPADPLNHLNFAGKNHVMAFFLVYIVSPDNRQTFIEVGHDDAIRLWLNGSEVVEPGVLPFLNDFDLTRGHPGYASISLRAGTNILLAAVADSRIDWGFSLRVLDHQGLRITADHPDRDAIRRCESQYRYLSIAGSGNGWDRGDLGRVLACVGGRVWKGRVRLDEEDFKFVGHRTGWLSDWLGWNEADWPFGNFHCATAGIYDVVFDEDQPHDPVLILVRPFA